MREDTEGTGREGRGRRDQTDLVDGVFFGLSFIWGALVLAAELSGLKADFSCWTTGWGVFFTGTGALAVLLSLVRFMLPKYRHKIGQGIVFGCIMLGVGLGTRAVWIWPALLGVIGLTILRGVYVQRRTPS